jgi:uncharacterized protein YhaN
LAKNKVKAAEHENKDLNRDLVDFPEIKEPLALVQTVKLAQKAGDIDSQLKKSRTDVQMNKKECFAELKRIGLWSGDLEALMELSLPRSKAVQQFEQNYSEIAEERREIKKELKTAAKDLQHIRVEIKKAEYTGEVPSEEDLSLTREKREQGWQLVRRKWLNHENVTKESKSYNPELSLPDAYEGYVGQADTLADRLRREADRVANAASFRAQKEALQEIIAEKNKDIAELEIKAQKLHETWLRIWQPSKIAPLSPKEMIGWLSDIDKLRFKVGDIFKREKEIGREVQHRKEIIQALQKELNSIEVEGGIVGEELGPVLIFAETVLERIAGQKANFKKFKEQQEQVEKAYSQAKEGLEVAQEAMTNWQKEWQKAFMDLGLTSEVSTIEAIDLIENLQNCFAKFNEADYHKKLIELI